MSLLDILRRMQELDDQARGLREERDAVAAARAGVEAEEAQASAAAAAIRSELAELQKRTRSREIDLEALEERRERLKTQRNQVKTNKEYSALQMELQGVGADIDKAEEALLADMAAVDALKARIREVEATEAQARERLAGEREREQGIAGRLDGEIATLRAAWEEAAAPLPAETTDLYRRIAAGRDGQAVAAADGGNCSGCNMGLPPQTINLLRNGQGIVQCRSCQRILYLKAD